MDQMKPQLEINKEYKLLYAWMRRTKYCLASVKQCSQRNSLNISLKQCSCVISQTNNGIIWKQSWLTIGIDSQMINGKRFVTYSLKIGWMMNNLGFVVDMLDTSTQKLVLLHVGGGTGKIFVTCKIFEELTRCTKICHCTCPTGVGASHLPQGQTFHSIFRTWTPSLSAGIVIDNIFKSLWGNQLKMVMVDEVSMLSAQVLVLLDTRLQSMYTSDQTFGGISILLIGDFIQLTITNGCDLWSVMYGTVSANDVLYVTCFNNFVCRSWRSIFDHWNVKYIRRGWQVSVHYHKCIYQDKNGLQKITNYTNP